MQRIELTNRTEENQTQRINKNEEKKSLFKLILRYNLCGRWTARRRTTQDDRVSVTCSGATAARHNAIFELAISCSQCVCSACRVSQSNRSNKINIDGDCARSLIIIIIILLYRKQQKLLKSAEKVSASLACDECDEVTRKGVKKVNEKRIGKSCICAERVMCSICEAASCVLPHSECIPFDCYFIIRINIIYLSRVSACCSPKKEIHRVAASAVTHFGTILAMALDAIAVGFTFLS